MTDNQLGIVNNCIGYGSGAINSAGAKERFARFGTSFRNDPHFALLILTQLMVTHPELISWLDNNGYEPYATVLKEHSRLSQQGPPDFNKLCTELMGVLKDPEDICGNLLIASSISSFFDDGANLASIYLDVVMKKDLMDIIFAFVEERFWMLLYSALWNCDYDGFREMALQKID